jgi:hypothetical protein
VNIRNRISTFSIIGILPLIIFSASAFGQDYEERMTEYSEKFLAYSQVFVKFASQSINTETEYEAALTASDVAEEFHLHTSYIGDLLLILKIIKKHEAERELAAGLVRLRIENVIKDCGVGNEKIKKAIKNVENASIVKTANAISEDISALQKDLEGLLDKELNEG